MAAQRKIYLSALDALLIPAVTCAPGDNRTVMRLYYGDGCAAWQANNSAGCWWDSSKQLFIGAGCEAPAAAQCACLHLTDFSGGGAPKLGVASLSQMLSLNPSDLFTKLWFLATVVFVLFGFMILTAATMYLTDRRRRYKVLLELRSARFGHRTHPPGGAWTWYLPQQTVTADFEPLEGPLVTFSKLLGVPLIRLRTALPEELFSGCLAGAVGRVRGGLAPAAEERIGRQMLARLSVSERPSRIVRLQRRALMPPRAHSRRSSSGN